jgi:hypothetical protein
VAHQRHVAGDEFVGAGVASLLGHEKDYGGRNISNAMGTRG